LIEIHDSTLSGIESVGRETHLLLSPAYVHRSEGRPGVDLGTGWLQEVAVIIREAVVESSPSRLPCWLSDGALSVGDKAWENAIPLPLDGRIGPVSLRAVTEHGEPVVVRGAGIEVVPRGEPRFVEEVPGATE
jgi:hypothetical protein